MKITMCITHVSCPHVLHLYFHIYNTCTGYTPVLHLQFYMWNTHAGNTPALNVWNMSIIGVLIIYIINQKHHSCNTFVSHTINMQYSF